LLLTLKREIIGIPIANSINEKMMTMSKIITVVFINFLSFFSFDQGKNNNIVLTKSEVSTSQAKVDIKSSAEIVFTTDQHDFGTVPEGPQAKFDFEFSNQGKEPLLLTDVHASCGCTTPMWPKEPIMPGAKSKITVVYNTKGRAGNFAKSIVVKSNAKSGDKIISIKGFVEAAVKSAAPNATPNLMNEIKQKN
jgi:ABC-type phosphate transport system substrate-binding protein